MLHNCSHEVGAPPGWLTTDEADEDVDDDYNNDDDEDDNHNNDEYDNDYLDDYVANANRTSRKDWAVTRLLGADQNQSRDRCCDQVEPFLVFRISLFYILPRQVE